MNISQKLSELIEDLSVLIGQLEYEEVPFDIIALANDIYDGLEEIQRLVEKNVKS